MKCVSDIHTRRSNRHMETQPKASSRKIISLRIKNYYQAWLDFFGYQLGPQVKIKLFCEKSYLVKSRSYIILLIGS